MDRIGRYKIVRELGRGAMGVVYHAIDPNIGRPVAIKTIHFGGNRKPEEVERMRERLFREARSAGMLSHPGIVTIYDVEQPGVLAYIAMEYVEGPTLAKVVRGPRPLEPPACARCAPPTPPRPRLFVHPPGEALRGPGLRPPQGHFPPRHKARQYHDL